MEIFVQIKNVYGVETVYPACPASLVFAQIAGTKTLSGDKLRLVRQLGVTVTVRHPVVYEVA